MISKEEVQHIAKLARLKLGEQEIEKMQKDMAAVLDYFDILKKAKSDPNLRIASESTNVLRKDVARKDNEAGDLIAAAPDTKDGYIKVKQVL